MAVNKNFVVKNGLEVATDVILANATSKNVGIGSTQPTFTLDVRGGIGATDVKVSGFTTLAQDLQVGTSGSVFYVSDSNNNVGVGTSVPNSAYTLDVRSPVSTGQTALYVYGDMRVTGDINLDDITLDDAEIQDLTITDTLHVTGLTTFVGFTTFNDYVFIQDGLNVTGTGITATYDDAGGSLTIAIDATVLTTSSSINDLTDVNTTGVTNGQVLVYNSTSGDFEPGSVGSATSLVDSDSDLTLTDGLNNGLDYDLDNTDMATWNTGGIALTTNGGIFRHHQTQAATFTVATNEGAVLAGPITITGTVTNNGTMVVI